MEMHEFTDEQQIAKFKLGDRTSYTELVNRYKDKIINFIYRFMGDLDASEDLAQETFLKVYIKKDSYREIAKFSTCLYTIAANLARTELRKIIRRKTFSITELSHDDREFIIESTD